MHRCTRHNYRTAYVVQCVSSTEFHTTNFVDVNWTVTVINQHRLAPMLLLTPRITPSAHRRGRGPPWRIIGWTQFFGVWPVEKRNFT